MAHLGMAPAEEQLAARAFNRAGSRGGALVRRVASPLAGTAQRSSGNPEEYTSKDSSSSSRQQCASV